jgi:two-component system, NtrC family, sensor kinase
MEQPKFPANESERLQALLDYEILDTPPESSYDDITLLASEICQAPIALISLIDKDRQWFKSRRGLDAEETDRNISFCAHAIHNQQLTEIPDAVQDQRFKDNPVVVDGPKIRFYAGAPLITPEGFVLGTLCVVDSQPKKLSPSQKTALEALAKQVMMLFELHRSKRESDERFMELQQLSKLVHRQQEQLIHSSRMACLGQMSKGLSHEINNPLAVINLVTDRVARTREVTEESIQALKNSITRISKITHGLKTFSAADEPDTIHGIDLRIVIEEVLSFFAQRMLTEGVELNFEGPDRVPAMASIVDMRHAIMNLLTNSMEALRKCSRKWINIELREEGEQVILSFSDAGPKLPRAMFSLILEPFYTTKEVGQGPGLGLSIVKGLAERNGGSFHYLAEAKNNLFEIRLKAFRGVI